MRGEVLIIGQRGGLRGSEETVVEGRHASELRRRI